MKWHKSIRKTSKAYVQLMFDKKQESTPLHAGQEPASQSLPSSVHIQRISPSDEPERHPGSDWTRFVLISDTHSRIGYQIPDGDVLIHAGDLTKWGTVESLKV